MRWTEAQAKEFFDKRAKEQANPNQNIASVPSLNYKDGVFTIPLAPVTKKNHNNLIDYGSQCPVCKRRQYSKLLPSTPYKKYEANIEPFMAELKAKTGLIDYPINLKCLFYCDKRRKSDLVGYLQAIQDIMSTYGVLSDDNRNIVASTDGSRVLYDKSNPRTEITITKLSDYEVWPFK